jgi:dsDNA-binding SOS-regulon protein
MFLGVNICSGKHPTCVIKETPMNEHAQKLQTFLEKDSLTAKEVQEGVVACFLAINRDFVKRRLGDVPDEDVDEALSRLIT